MQLRRCQSFLFCRSTRRKYVPFHAYGDSKLANILFTRALVNRLPPSVLAFSLHPGVIPTNLSRSTGALGAVFRTVGRLFMKTVAQGAATSVFAATAPELEGASGAYLSDCAIATPSPEALDDALADKVWALSVRCVAGG
jgi:WW domain-containing oxidoreductase